MLKNSTGPWSVCGSRSHSYTWDVFSLVNLACDQKNPVMRQTALSMTVQTLGKFYLLIFSLLIYKIHTPAIIIIVRPRGAKADLCIIFINDL